MTIACNFPHCFFQNRPAGILPHVQSPSATKRRRARHGSNPANIALESSTVFRGRISSEIQSKQQCSLEGRFTWLTDFQASNAYNLQACIASHLVLGSGIFNSREAPCLKMFYSAGKPNFPRIDNSDPDAFGITVFQRREVCDPCGDRRP